MLGNFALNEHSTCRRRDAACKPVDEHFVSVLFDGLSFVVGRRQGMPISHEKEAVVLVLQLCPILQGTVIVSNMQSPRWSHS